MRRPCRKAGRAKRLPRWPMLPTKRPGRARIPPHRLPFSFPIQPPGAGRKARGNRTTRTTCLSYSGPGEGIASGYRATNPGQGRRVFRHSPAGQNVGIVETKATRPGAGNYKDKAGQAEGRQTPVLWPEGKAMMLASLAFCLILVVFLLAFFVSIQTARLRSTEQTLRLLIFQLRNCQCQTLPHTPPQSQQIRNRVLRWFLEPTR